MPVATQPVQFRSPHSLLRLVRRGAVERMTIEGRMVQVEPEVVYEFRRGVLEVEPGQDVLPDGEWNAETGEPERQDAVAWLRAFAVQNNRFFEVVPEAPDAAGLLHQLAEAQIANDLATIEAIGDGEAATFQRPVILERAKVAFEAVTKALKE